MCGIAGLIGEGGRERVEQMVARLRHRGPDNCGVWHDAEVALAHARLSIIDRSEAGHQPMVLDDLVITYNGEIYNFQELRARLPGPFHSHSDTEVLLHLYREHGDRCVEMLEGMFAFAIWDRRRRRLFAARDPLGIKPFIYRCDGDGIAFASEIKALLAGGTPPIDRSAIRDYLTYGYIPAPKSVYVGIAKLPAAHTLVWEGGRTTIRQYWAASPQIRLRDPEAARHALDATLKHVIPQQTISDVPVGVFLSGGIDSATISTYVRGLLAFTLGLERSARSEVDQARQLADSLGMEHRTAVARSAGITEALRTIATVFDEPFGDSAAWSAYLLCQLARPLVTVALSGEGGDELFCGYPRYWSKIGERSSALTRLGAWALPPLSRAGHSLQRRAATGFEADAGALSSLAPRQVRALLHPDYLDPDYDELWFYRCHWHADLPPLQRLRWLDLHTNLPEGLLVKVDRSSMAHSMEVRPPMLDRRLVELALGIDPELLVDVGARRGKKLLRDLLEPKVPPGYLERPKSGFGLPLRDWMKRSPQVVEGAVRRLIDAGVLRRPVDAEFRRIWSLLVLDAWMTVQ